MAVRNPPTDGPKTFHGPMKLGRLDIAKATNTSFLSAPRSAPVWVKKFGDTSRFKSLRSISGSRTCSEVEELTSSTASSPAHSSSTAETSSQSLTDSKSPKEVLSSETNGEALPEDVERDLSIEKLPPSRTKSYNALQSANSSTASTGWVDMQCAANSCIENLPASSKVNASGRFSLSITSSMPFTKLGTSFKAARSKTSKSNKRISVDMIGQPLTSRHLVHTSDPDQLEVILKNMNHEVMGIIPESDDTQKELRNEECEENLTIVPAVELGSPLLASSPADATPHPELTQTIVLRPQTRHPGLTLDFSSPSQSASTSSGASRLNSLNVFLSMLSENEEKLDRSCSPSLITVEKAAATKIFFERYYDLILKRPKDRDQRKRLIEDELARLNVDENEREEILMNWNRSETAYLRDTRSRVGIEKFKKLKTIGHGAFGVVSLVREETTGQLLAMKQMRKSEMLHRGQEGHIRAERDLMTAASSVCRWIVRLIYSFQDVDHLYLVMEYMGGGDMLNLLIQRDTFPESMAKFYVAEMILAIEEAHKLGYIHRDIKPDNFLFDREGHVKLSDFGLATDFHWAHDAAYYEHQRHELLRRHEIDLENDLSDLKKLDQAYSLDEDQTGNHLSTGQSQSDRLLTIRDRKRKKMAYSVVGTNNYMAPEVLKSDGYDHACDWWSLGVILFEMVYGYPPFSSRSRQTTRTRILQWKSHLRLPSSPRISSQATHFIRSLLCDRKERLGSPSRRSHLSQSSHLRKSDGRNFDPNIELDGANELKAHPWFTDVDFEAIHLQTPPFVPDLRSETDTRYFEDNIDDNPLPPPGGPGAKLQARDALLGHSKHGADVLETRKRHAFVGYTFKSPPREVFDPRKGFMLRSFTSDTVEDLTPRNAAFTDSHLTPRNATLTDSQSPLLARVEPPREDKERRMSL